MNCFFLAFGVAVIDKRQVYPEFSPGEVTALRSVQYSYLLMYSIKPRNQAR